ncbi:MAG: DUF2167 domain-containing protein [Flavobacterium sp.]|uniref:DUF2167 domain-containing protein n=1 Tax=Flavobacterium sp. TaxID=239 RepID=UPI003267DB83
MKNIITSLLLFLAFTTTGLSQNQDSLKIDYEKIEKSLIYKTGKIEFPSGNATLNVPKGFKFLDAKQTQYVLKDLWGNPEDTSILGSIVPEKKGVMNDGSWLFVINYQEDGYVKDDDAQDINYDDLLKEIQEDMRKENPERAKQGFETAELIGWASKPFYDEKLKVLHWAKEIKFGKSKDNTLNYDLRVLGRKGMYNISAVASMHELAEVKASIPNIINSIQFKEGNTYFNFDEDTDTVAAWTIGGLVAGKVLAKVGLFALIAKFGKLILVAILGGFAAIKKFIFGKKDQEVSKPKTEELAEETKTKEEE